MSMTGAQFDLGAFRDTGDQPVATIGDVPCQYRGHQIGVAPCELCGDRGREMAIYACAVFGQATLGKRKAGRQLEAACLTCDRRQPARRNPWWHASDILARDLGAIRAAVPSSSASAESASTPTSPVPPPPAPGFNLSNTPMREVSFDAHLLPGRNPFNAAVARWQGRTLLCYRDGYSYSSRLALCELDSVLRPIPGSARWLERPFPEFQSHEDPRFFEHDGSLWLSWVIYRRGPATSMAIARMDGNLRLVEPRRIHYPQAGPVEKNWIFFSQGGRLWAEYRLWDGEHHVLAIEGDRAESAHVTQHDARWNLGPMRGGTNTVQVGDLRFGFFHSKLRRQYHVGAYCFVNGPPFGLVGYTPAPLLSGEWFGEKTRWGLSVVFPCGAMFDGDSWLVSAGYNDRTVKFFACKHADVAAAMTRVAPGAVSTSSWQRWEEDDWQWLPVGRVAPGYQADPPRFGPQEGEVIETPAFPTQDFQAAER